MNWFEWSEIMIKELEEWKKTAPRLTYEEAYSRIRKIGLFGDDHDSRMKILDAGLWITATLVDFDDGVHLDSRPCFLNSEGQLTKMKFGPLNFKMKDMVVAKLHIICGNCGSADGFEHDILLGQKMARMKSTRVFLKCKNCGTIHDLDNNSKLNKISEEI